MMPAKTTGRVTESAATTPLATVAATLSETKAPAKLRIAAHRTAVRGLSARVLTLVAIAFAVSLSKSISYLTLAFVTSSTSPPSYPS